MFDYFFFIILIEADTHCSTSHQSSLAFLFVVIIYTQLAQLPCLCNRHSALTVYPPTPTNGLCLRT